MVLLNIIISYTPAHMLVRQRLRAVLEARRSSSLCWRCSQGLPRYKSGLGQHETDNQGDGSFDNDLFFLTGRNDEIFQGSHNFFESTPHVPPPFKTPIKPPVPIHKERAHKEKLASGDLKITHHNVTRVPDNAPQFLPHSMIDPRIHFHRVDKIIHANKKPHLSPTDTEPLEQLNGDVVEGGGGGGDGNVRQLKTDTVMGKSESSQRLKQVQSLATSAYMVEYSHPAEGTALPVQKSFQIHKYPTRQIENSPPLSVKKVPVKTVRILRVGSTEHFVYTTQSAAKNDLVCRTTPPEEEPRQTPEEEQALHGELESVLGAFRDLQTSRSSFLDALNPSTLSMSSKTVVPPVEQETTRGEGHASLRSLRQQRRPNSYPNSMVQSRHYATATQSPPADVQVDPFVVEGAVTLEFASGAGIREHLRLWQEQQNKEAEKHDSPIFPLGNSSSTSRNFLTQSGEDDSFTKLTENTELDEAEHIDLSLDKDESTTDIFQNHAFLKKGDLVELTAKSEPILAIFVKDLVTQCQFYTMRGEWVNRELAMVKFAVSGFVHPGDLNDILPYLPTDEVAIEKLDRLQPMDINAPRDAGTKVLERMSAFNQAADSVFRRHADRLNRAYELIAPWHVRAGRTFKSLKEIAMTVLQKDAAELTQPMMWAVHRALMDSQNVTFDQMNFRQNPVYEIIPQQSLRNIGRVREWVREYQEDNLDQATAALKASLELKTQNPIASFVKKARIAIERSRMTRPLSTNGGVGPSLVKIEPVEPQLKTYKAFFASPFDENEKLIILYLDAWVTSRYINAMSNLSSLGPMILRAVGKYDGLDLTENIGYTFLQELGIITPWENKTVYKLRGLRLPGHDTVSEETTRLRSKARASLSKFEPIDSMEGLRKDWGDLPVFCIDSAETLERDDGVSLEPVNGKDSEYWVHVHVANPSAYMSPQSPTAQYAAQLAESVYFPECKYPMLDPSLASNHFSLDKNRPCLTFSARMTTAGEILEKIVTPGRVHNVHYLTPNTVGRGFGLDVPKDSETESILTVGGEIPAKPNDLSPKTGETLDPSHVGMLRILADLGKAASRRRAPAFYQTGAPLMTYPQVFLSKTVPRPFHLYLQHIRRFEGDPIISIEQEASRLGPINIMVADLMILAGDIAASWCSERNIPIPYRGLLRNPEPAVPPQEFKRDIIDTSMAAKGYVDTNDLLRYGRLLGKTATSATPLEHFALGLPAYCKATSPLRRYVDLYTHWQIEAALRHEAETSTSLVNTNNDDDSYLPFSRQAVEEYVSTAMYSQRKIAFAKLAATRHWIVQALHRAFYFGEAPLPKTFQVNVTGRAHGWANGMMKWLGVKVMLPQSPEAKREGGWRTGDVWETRIELVDPYHVSISMVAVRLLERDGKKYGSMDEGAQA